MDYNGLVEIVEAAMNRSDITARIPGFIQRVEEEVNTRLASAPVRPMVKTFTLPAITDRLDLPADFIDTIEMVATDGLETWPLARLEPNAPFDYYAKALAPGLTYNSSKIQHYRIVGDTLVLSAVPNPPFDLRLDCYTKLEPINENNSSNWLMDSHADVYQFGTLAHAGFFVRDYEFYNQNRDLFIGALDMVTLAYPERKREIALRAVDAPWSVPRWPVGLN
jgi:hypothetical protein